MIILTQENTTDNIIVTLNDSISIVAPFYLFVFENVTTKQQRKLVINSANDLSGYPTRFNEFEIPTAALFAGATAGQYNYFVYEQTSQTNTNATGLTMVEMGKAILKSTAFNYNGYTTQTNYSGYAG